MNGRFRRRHEPCAHVDPLGPQGKGGDQAAGVAKAAGGDHRNPDLVGGGGDQDEAWHVILTGMSSAFKAIDGNGVHPHALGREGVANRCAFVDDLDAVLLEFVDVLLRFVARSLHDLDAAFDDRGAIFRVWRGFDRRQDGQIDAEGFVGPIPASGNFGGEGFRGGLSEGGDEAQGPGIGHG